MNQLVVACLGTDQHPFPRLVGWLDALAVRRPAIDVVVQHGYSDPPLVATGHDFLAFDDLVALVEAADVMVCHGGPGTLMDAHRAGHFPIVVPRDPRFGEHVDGHQLRFAETVSAAGRADVAVDESRFDDAVEQHLAGTRISEVPMPTQRHARNGLHALVAELDGMPHHPSRRGPVLRSLRRAVLR